MWLKSARLTAKLSTGDGYVCDALELAVKHMNEGATSILFQPSVVYFRD